MFFRLRVHYPERIGSDTMSPWVLELFPVKQVAKLSTPYELDSSDISNGTMLTLKGGRIKRLYIEAPILQVEQLLIWSATYGERGARPDKIYDARWVERGDVWNQY